MEGKNLNRPSDHGTSICVVGWWPEPGSVNGIFIREQVKAIARHRPVEVIYMQVVKSRSPWPRIYEDVRVDEGMTVHRIAIRTPVRRFGIPKVLARMVLRRTLRRSRARDRIGLVHIHVRTDLTEVALPLAHTFGLPAVLTEHNSFYHLGIRSLPPIVQDRTRTSIRKWLARTELQHIMPVSHDLARVLHTDYGVAMERMTVVGNVAAEVFKPTATRVSGPFRLLLAAVWRPPKDHDVFIRAMALLPDAAKARCIVEWAGYGPDMERIRARCANEWSGIDVRFPGLLDKPDLARRMQQADLFVLPTTADNLPCVVLESLCCGTPVLSMSVNGVPEMINASNGILVPPSDPQALAEALLASINGNVAFDRDRIAHEALERYSPRAIGAAIEAVYAHVLDHHER